MLTETQQEDFDLMVIREEFAWRRSLPTKHQLRTMFGVRVARSGGSGYDKEAARERVDIVDLYERLTGTQVKRRSGRYIQVRCYSHGEDRLASASLDTQYKRFRCFGCGLSQDVFDLHSALMGCGFKESVKALSGG